jgi:RES domain-containing protein
VSFRGVVRGGRYLRVADPGWDDPLDSSFARVAGGRWNPPNSFGVVYLNATRHVAALNVHRLFRGLPYGPEDLDPDQAPVLVAASVPSDGYADVVTDEGCRAAGLPTSYPTDAGGGPIDHAVCRPIGQAAYDDGLPGIACRSAAPGAVRADEELAWFDRGAALRETERSAFDDWFWSASR